MSNSAVIREGRLLKIVPLPEPGAGTVAPSGPDGLRRDVVPLRFVGHVRRQDENFLSRPGAYERSGAISRWFRAPVSSGSPFSMRLKLRRRMAAQSSVGSFR